MTALRQSASRVSHVAAESKKDQPEGRSASPTPAAPADPRTDLLGEVAARGTGQRGPGRRSAGFVEKIAHDYGMLPGDLLAATLMHGLRRHLDQGGAPGAFLEARAIALAGSMQTTSAHAMGLLMSVARELMPYAHQKQPLLVDVEGKHIVFAMVQPDGASVAPGAGVIDLRPADVVASISDVQSRGSDASGRMDGQ